MILLTFELTFTYYKYLLKLLRLVSIELCDVIILLNVIAEFDYLHVANPHDYIYYIQYKLVITVC